MGIQDRKKLAVLNDQIAIRIIKTLFRYPMRPSIIAHYLTMSDTQAVRKRLRDLYARGLIQHQEDPGHRQARLWSLTSEGELLYERFLK